MPRKTVPVKESVKTSKKGEVFLSGAHQRNVEDKTSSRAKTKKPAKATTKKVGRPKKETKTVAGSTLQLAGQQEAKKVLQVSRVQAPTGQMAIFDSALVDEKTLKKLVSAKDAAIMEVDDSFASIEGRFDDRYGKPELWEVTVNGNDGYEMIAGVQTSSGKVVICDPSLVFDDDLYDEACAASRSNRGAASFAEGRAACFTTMGESECEATTFGERGRVVVRHEEDADDESDDYYDDYSSDSFDDFY